MRRWILTAAAALTIAAGASVMAQQPAPEQVQAERIQKRRAIAHNRVRERWQRLDKDKNGSISRDEWVRDPQVFDRLDANKDGNGSISREEWPGKPEVFDRLDTSKDGVLTREELAARGAARRR